MLESYSYQKQREFRSAFNFIEINREFSIIRKEISKGTVLDYLRGKECVSGHLGWLAKAGSIARSGVLKDVIYVSIHS